MKYLLPALLMMVALATSASAQDPFDGALPQIRNQPSNDTGISQDPRYDTPKQAVRRKAAWKAAQRRARLEMMKRVGYSPSRPPTSSLPFTTSPYRWTIVPATYYPIYMVY